MVKKESVEAIDLSEQEELEAILDKLTVEDKEIAETIVIETSEVLLPVHVCIGILKANGTFSRKDRKLSLEDLNAKAGN